MRTQGVAALEVLRPTWRKLVIASYCGAFFAAWTAYTDDPRLIGLWVWLLALVALLAAGLLHDRALAVAGPQDHHQAAHGAAHWTRADWAAVALLTLVALGLRLYRLSNALPPVHGDEGEMGLFALAAFPGSADGRRLLPFGGGFFGQPALFNYLQAAAMGVLGDTIGALRGLSVIAGTLCIAPLYAIGRMAWGRMAGLTAAWLLATSQLHVQFSRIALNNMETTLAAVVMIYLILRLDRTGDGLSRASPADGPLLLPIATGSLIGLGQYFYFGSRLLPIVALILIAILFKRRRITATQMGAIAFSFTLVVLPLAVFYAGHWSVFTSRLETVSIFSPSVGTHILAGDPVWPDDLPRLLWYQLSRNVQFFLGSPDQSDFYSAALPSFDVVTIAFFWLGLLLVIARASRFPETALLVWLGLGILLGGVMTNNPPNAPRLLIVAPAVFLVGGVFAQAAAHALLRLGPRLGRGALAGTAAALAAATFAVNARDYFSRYPAVHRAHFSAEIAEAVVADVGTGRFYLLGAPILFASHGPLRFIARGAEISDLAGAEQLPDALARRADCRPPAVIAIRERLADLAAIERAYPGGVEDIHRDAQGAPMFAIYRLPAGSAPRPSGCGMGAVPVSLPPHRLAGHGPLEAEPR